MFGCHSSAQSFSGQKISAEDSILEAGQGFAESRLAVQNVSGGVFSFGFGTWKLEGFLIDVSSETGGPSKFRRSSSANPNCQL